MEQIISNKDKLQTLLDDIHNAFKSDFTINTHIDKITHNGFHNEDKAIRELIMELSILFRVQSDIHTECVTNITQQLKEVYNINLDMCNHIIEKEPIKTKLLRYFTEVPLTFKVVSISVVSGSIVIAYAIEHYQPLNGIVGLFADIFS